MYEPWILVTRACLSDSPRMPPLLRAYSIRAKMSMTVNVMISSGMATSRRWIELVHRWSWESQSHRSFSTWQLVWFIGMCMIKGMFQTDFRYIGQSWLYMHRPQIYFEDEYIEYPARHPEHNLLITIHQMSLAAVSTSSRTRTRQATSEMPRRSASSQKRQKPEMRQRGRRNRPLPTGKPPQRKALLAPLPELPKEIQPHPEQLAAAAALRSSVAAMVRKVAPEDHSVRTCRMGRGLGSWCGKAACKVHAMSKWNGQPCLTGSPDENVLAHAHRTP